MSARSFCEQAFRFYEQHLGGRITGIILHGEQPNAALPADWKGKVLHARIEIGSTVLMGADIAQAEPSLDALPIGIAGDAAPKPRYG